MHEYGTVFKKQKCNFKVYTLHMNQSFRQTQYTCFYANETVFEAQFCTSAASGQAVLTKQN